MRFRNCLLAGLSVITGCLSTPEAKAPVVGTATFWATNFEKIDWISEWTPKMKGKFGLENLSVEEEAGGSFERFLRAQYPKGSSSPRGSRADGVAIGGGQFLGTLANGSVDRLFLRYFVRFPDSFEFVKGGKLPGLYGGSQISGGRIPDGTNGFSTRFMWRTNGQGEVYAYMPSSDIWGTSLGRGTWLFEKAKWQCIEQEVVLNTPGQLDGVVRAWIDGKIVYENTKLLFRSVPHLKIEGVFFSTFFGGGDKTWATPHDTHADFAAFATGPSRIGCSPRSAE